VYTNLASPPGAKDGCTDCKASNLQRQASPKKKKGAKIKLQQTLDLVMRTALPEEIEKICHHNLISDSTLTLQINKFI